MYEINIQTAGIVVCIKTEYRPSNSLFTDFRTDLPADLQIVLTNEDLDFIDAETRGKVTVRDYRILGKISEALIEYDVLLCHGAVISHNGAGYMFTAPSGTGKTTHIYKWIEQLSDTFVVNGDKPFIKFFNDGSQPLAYGSPWAGKENLYSNTAVPLKAIIFIKRAKNNHIEEIKFSQFFPFLLQQTYRPRDENKMRKTVKLLQKLNGNVKFYMFECNNFKDDCFQVAYDALAGE